jgi:hypothetical protein
LGIGKVREKWEGVLRGLIERTAMASSQHRSLYLFAGMLLFAQMLSYIDLCHVAQ